MRIALASTSMSTSAGPNTGQAHLARQLRALGHDVSQWRIGFGPEDAIYVMRSRGDIEREGRDTVDLDTDFLPWGDLWKRHEVDVVHITNPGMMGQQFDEALDTTAGPLVLSVHDPYEFHSLRKALVRWMHQSQRVMFIGRTFMRWARRCEYLPQVEFDRKARYTPQPYTRHPVTAAWDERTREYAHAFHQPRAINTSPWRSNKNIPMLVEAAGLLPRGVIVSFHTSNRNEEIEARVEEDPAWPRCENHPAPWSWYDDAEEIYGRAGTLVDLVYFNEDDTGRTEYPILEAWDFGVTPIVLRAFAGPPTEQGELLHGWNVFAASMDPGDVARTILMAIEHPLSAAPLMESLRPHLATGTAFETAYQEAIDEYQSR